MEPMMIAGIPFFSSQATHWSFSTARVTITPSTLFSCTTRLSPAISFSPPRITIVSSPDSSMVWEIPARQTLKKPEVYSKSRGMRTPILRDVRAGLSAGAA